MRRAWSTFSNLAPSKLCGISTATSLSQHGYDSMISSDFAYLVYINYLPKMNASRIRKVTLLTSEFKVQGKEETTAQTEKEWNHVTA